MVCGRNEFTQKAHVFWRPGSSMYDRDVLVVLII